MNVKSHFDMDIYKLSYGYSFYHNDDIELMLTAGLHVMGIDLGLSATGKVDGVDNSFRFDGLFDIYVLSS